MARGRGRGRKQQQEKVIAYVPKQYNESTGVQDFIRIAENIDKNFDRNTDPRNNPIFGLLFHKSRHLFQIFTGLKDDSLETWAEAQIRSNYIEDKYKRFLNTFEEYLTIEVK